jgi:hypothetical protein
VALSTCTVGITVGRWQDNLGVMSIAFMLPSRDDAVIWRGVRKNGLLPGTVFVHQTHSNPTGARTD